MEALLTAFGEYFKAYGAIGIVTVFLPIMLYVIRNIYKDKETGAKKLLSVLEKQGKAEEKHKEEMKELFENHGKEVTRINQTWQEREDLRDKDRALDREEWYASLKTLKTTFQQGIDQNSSMFEVTIEKQTNQLNHLISTNHDVNKEYYNKIEDKLEHITEKVVEIHSRDA